mmetsp:Transcript_15191/g.40870  ORF Transcript_15191/g.40870 Transcript_15191/m.40870 type:complete len:121 (+) Transcript_15191:78-440(+)
MLPTLQVSMNSIPPLSTLDELRILQADIVTQALRHINTAPPSPPLDEPTISLLLIITVPPWTSKTPPSFCALESMILLLKIAKTHFGLSSFKCTIPPSLAVEWANVLLDTVTLLPPSPAS